MTQDPAYVFRDYDDPQLTVEDLCRPVSATVVTRKFSVIGKELTAAQLRGQEKRTLSAMLKRLG